MVNRNCIVYLRWVTAASFADGFGEVNQRRDVIGEVEHLGDVRAAPVAVVAVRDESDAHARDRLDEARHRQLQLGAHLKHARPAYVRHVMYECSRRLGTTKCHLEHCTRPLWNHEAVNVICTSARISVPAASTDTCCLWCRMKMQLLLVCCRPREMTTALPATCINSKVCSL